jgi:hypothetical protein
MSESKGSRKLFAELLVNIVPGIVDLHDLATAVRPGIWATVPISSDRGVSLENIANFIVNRALAEGWANELVDELAKRSDESLVKWVREWLQTRAKPTGDASASAVHPEAPSQLLCTTLQRRLGDDAPRIANELVDRLTDASNEFDLELFDMTRFALEYLLLTEETLTAALLLDLAHDRREASLEEFRRLLNEASKAGTLHGSIVPVLPHVFFPRTLERQEDWKIYFDTVRDVAGLDEEMVSTLCRIRTDGFVAPQFLVAGLLPRFEDDWRPIIKNYENQVRHAKGSQSPFVSFQVSQWNTWLMWGPSIPICQCKEWEGIHAFQYGYGDENNSIPIIGAAKNAPISLENIQTAYDPKDPSVGAVLRQLTGRLRWGPWLLRRSTSRGSPAKLGEPSGERPPAGSLPLPAASAQRAMYEDNRAGSAGALLFQVEMEEQADATEPVEGGGQGHAAEQSYFSAYLWLMFLVARKPSTLDQAPRRLVDIYPAFTELAPDRGAKHLWRELLPVYVHANIADARALEMHRSTLINNAVSLLREIWISQPMLFPEVGQEDLCFCLVGGSDYSGCGNRIRFSSDDQLLERLRVRIAKEAEIDPKFASSILLPPSDETTTTRPAELVAFYSACNLPSLVADYYTYLAAARGDVGPR